VMYMSVCSSVCWSVLSHILETTCLNFTKYSALGNLCKAENELLSIKYRGQTQIDRAPSLLTHELNPNPNPNPVTFTYDLDF